MARTKGTSARQLAIIRNLSRRKYSANQINRILRTKHISMRRQKLLGYVREFKDRPSRLHTEKYVRVRYRHKPIEIGFGKRVILRGKWKGKDKEIEKIGEGRDLYHWIKDNMIEAKRREGWDSRPQVVSG